MCKNKSCCKHQEVPNKRRNVTKMYVQYFIKHCTTVDRQPDGENFMRSFSSSNADMTDTGVPVLMAGLKPDIYNSITIHITYQTSQALGSAARTVVITLFMLWRVRNCRRYYYYCINGAPEMAKICLPSI